MWSLRVQIQIMLNSSCRRFNPGSARFPPTVMLAAAEYVKYEYGVKQKSNNQIIKLNRIMF